MVANQVKQVLSQLSGRWKRTMSAGVSIWLILLSLRRSCSLGQTWPQFDGILLYPEQVIYASVGFTILLHVLLSINDDGMMLMICHSS